jgi:cell division protein FtsZ
MYFDLPKSEEKNIILVIGVGGGGSNAVNYMYKNGITGVDFMICNTDKQALEKSPIPSKTQLGPLLTEGLGAGSTPEKGKQACIESLEDVKSKLSDGYKMIFIAAGMGGGTGTGAAPIIAKLAKELNLLTVGIVTTPFNFEGKKRVTQGFDGIDDLRKNVDTLIIVSNDKLRDIHGNMSISDAFKQADNVLATAAKGISEIITVPGYVNVDFADVDKVMRNSGVSIMGIGSAEGDDRAIRAIDEALNSPLLEENNIAGSKNILVNISYGKKEATMDEIFSITNFVQEEAGDAANLIWGNCYDESLDDKISVTIIATGFETFNNHFEVANNGNTAQKKVTLDGDDDEKKLSKGPFYDLGGRPTAGTSNAQVFEFDGSRGFNTPSNFDRYKSNSYSRQEPFVKANDERKIEDDRRKKLMQEAALRRERLRQMNTRMTSPQNIADLESEPAYLRRGMNIENPQHSSEPVVSRWSISEDGEPHIKENNSYLHDNVD